MVIGLVGGAMLILMGIQMFKAIKSIATNCRDLPYNSLIAGITTTGANPHFFLRWA